MTEITWFDRWPQGPDKRDVESAAQIRGDEPAGSGKKICRCDCLYNSMDGDGWPLIEEIAQIFPDEWLAFVLPPAEDERDEPVYGALIAHSPDPDEVYDALNTVLWNQHIYVFFNGDFEALKASYGDRWQD